MSSAAKKPQYLLLLRQPPGGAPAPDELSRIMAQFGQWMAGLHAKGMVVGTNGLEVTGKVVRGPRGATTISDGPYLETKEIVGGYVQITADNLDQALAAAGDCPGLDFHMAVEVRPVRAAPERPQA